jgi:hypothetical protein
VPDLRKIEKCSACEAPIVWTETSTGAKMPVDASPSEAGNVALFPTVEGRWIALVLGKRTHAAPGSSAERYTSHFATCPYAEHFRKRGRR